MAEKPKDQPKEQPANTNIAARDRDWSGEAKRKLEEKKKKPKQ